MTINDFWLTSGWHLLDKDKSGCLVPTEDFMRAYFYRPEVAPIEESCEAEIELHKKLVEAPFIKVEKRDLDLIKDKDVVFNYEVILKFREFLSNYATLEAAYLAISRGQSINFPPLFVDQLVQIILRNILNENSFALQVRASELFFRTQVVTIAEDEIMVADEAVVQLQAEQKNIDTNKPNQLEVDIDILRESSADNYWERSDKFDTSIDLAYTKPGLDALARVIEKWIFHFLSIEVSVQPMQKIEDDKWSWHLGLDSDATSILNDLYEGADVSEDRLKQILCLFQLEAKDGFKESMQGKPVYVGLAMGQKSIIKFKPQNLLTNLPLADLL
ncbi:DUF6352 family protein [Candidatus Levibacter sp. Uisw_134_01]|jgi:hypothetical protein|uniref:DUF6352 family protein n=1 Tax=Candidatus Levibacter sp. Uisw_134_01 TaxID=3230999 RepID=UPI003D3A435B|tara:strand:- start:1734 stop:2726 length:993 start_codon:yes stop_codon:yes gene_type:complete